MLAFRARGWELVMSGVTQPLVAGVSGRATRVTKIGEDRFSFELPLGQPVERMLSELVAGGATLVSLNPIRDTLEDFFVEQVTTPDMQAHDRGLGKPKVAGGRR